VYDTGGGETDGGVDAASQRRAVRERYAGIATGTDGDESDCGREDGCCADGADGPGVRTDSDERARRVGCSGDDLDAAGEANLGLGCGNPNALASLEGGETVLDLGSGAGVDCFLAAREVGGTGRVIDVDMTPEMVEQARKNAGERPRERRIPPRGDRAPAGRGPDRRRRRLELRESTSRPRNHGCSARPSGCSDRVDDRADSQ